MSPFWRIYVNKRSGAHITTSQGKLALRPDHIYLIPAWLSFQTGLTRETHQDYIHFELSGLPPSLHRRCFLTPIAYPRKSLLLDLCKSWQAGFQTTPAWPHLARASALVHTCMARVFENLNNSAELSWLSAPSVLHPALEHIDNHLNQRISNRDLALRCGMSVDHFIKYFRRHVGLTPARYGLEKRLSAAAQLLVETGEKLDSIAELTGFTDRFHLSKAFKTTLKQSPATYRRQHRSAN